MTDELIFTSIDILTEEAASREDPYNKAAMNNRFKDMHNRLSTNSQKAYLRAIQNFTTFLETHTTLTVGNLWSDIHAWKAVRWGMVEGLKHWMLKKGFSISSINLTLAAVRAHAKEAALAGFLSHTEYVMIKSIEGYGYSDGKRLDTNRAKAGISTRIGKKPPAHTVNINEKDAQGLKLHFDTPQGRRDTLLMCLLLDHGLRRGEISPLLAENCWIEQENGVTVGYFRFFREKVNKWQTHRMSQDTLIAYLRYVRNGDCPHDGCLLRSSNKDGTLGKTGMSCGAIYERVKELGRQQNLKGLSPHICRHYYTTIALRYRSNPADVQQAGGWSSPAMVTRYREENGIANDGIFLPKGILIDD